MGTRESGLFFLKAKNTVHLFIHSSFNSIIPLLRTRLASTNSSIFSSTKKLIPLFFLQPEISWRLNGVNLVGNLTHDRKISRNLLRLDPSYTDNGASLECFVTHPWGSRRRSHPAAGFQGCRYEKLDVRHQPVVECPDPQVILVLLISN